MIFGKRKRHKLPKFPATVGQTFRSLTEVLGIDAIEELRAAVDTNFLDIMEKSKKNENIDVKSARQLVDLCYYLLDEYQEFPESKQKLIVAGVRYFAIADDPFDDATFASGFYDDMRVMNHVLEELGIEDRYFDLH